MTANRMTLLQRLGAGALLTTTLVACGSPQGADAPKDTSVADFCEVMSELSLANANDFVDELVEVGTPADIPADAREGFEIMIDKATDDDITTTDQEKVLALTTYLESTCAGIPAD